MKSLFKNADAEICSLINYVDTFLNDQNEYLNLFQLPPIQRNSVWNIAQVERLWDSILRGYPIGSFLVAPRRLGAKARDLYTGIQQDSAKEGYFLLDGQQRTRALLLGFKPNENARLWIDLNPSLVFDNVEFNDRKFLLRVVTNYQPWGMSDRNPSDKLNETQKHNARKELRVERLHYDYEVNINNGMGSGLSKVFSWPIKSELPVPLDALISLCGGTSGKFIPPTWADAIKLIPERYHEASKVPKEPTEYYKLVLEAIKPIIDTIDLLIRTRTIVLLFQNENKIEQIENVQDNMEVLFRRINSGGTVLQGEEMAYSLLKASWDSAYEMVSHIVQDKSIGYLLPSTGIVMAAARLARFIQDKNDLPNPGIGNFRKWIGERDEPNSFLLVMQSLLEKEGNRKSKFHETIDSFCELVLYREHNQSDIGFPKKTLLAIKPVLLHPVLIWIFTIKSDKRVLEENRIPVLRYLMTCLLTIEKHEKVSKVAIDTLKEEHGSYFPDLAIYRNMLKARISIKIPTPTEFGKPFKIPVDGFFRHWDDLFNIPDDPYNTFRNYFWNKSKHLLLWFQRAYAAKWFRGYDPTSNDAFDTPYDWDHIVPYSHLITSGASPEIYSSNKDLNNKFYWNRHLYVNSIGNYRIWPFWANRSDNNQCHTLKLRMGKTDLQSDLVALELGLDSTEEFFQASAICYHDEQIWYKAGGVPRDWPESRRIAWQQAVENRVINLYIELYTIFKLGDYNAIGGIETTDL